METHPIRIARFVPAMLLISPVLAGLAPQPALADGFYIPEKAVLKTPSIPRQRAILVYKDKTERLIIESAFDAEGQRFGWIIPVPARPTAVEQTTSGLISTLSTRTLPKITHDLLRRALWLLAIPFAFITIWAIGVCSEDPARQKRTHTVVRAAALVMIPVLLSFLLLPSLGRTGSILEPRTDGIRIDSAEIVGNYEVTVLQADSPEALNRWLDDNGFASLPDAGRTIVADYIAQGWHFVAARL